jgi:hypothetical protein
MIYCRKNPPVSVFLERGIPQREFFPHTAVVLRKQYPDAFALLEGRGVPQEQMEASDFFQINIYSDHLSGFPDELFTNRQINWHHQQFGQKGLIAAAGLYLHQGSLIITVLQSDLCQQLYRHAPLHERYKTQIEKRFGHWHRILLNAILDFAREYRLDSVHCPTANTIVRHTRKAIDPGLFERIYDSPARYYLHNRVQHGSAEYWKLPAQENADRIVQLEPAPLPGDSWQGTPICVFHDIEENVDTAVPPEECRKHLKAMLDIEKQHGVLGTYNILGKLFYDKRSEVLTSDARHSLSFHSFDHNIADETQLTSCREVDLQVRGYRPPQSVLTRELTDYRLSYLNFEWLACGSSNFGAASCFLQNGIVKIPISTDDYPLQTHVMDYGEWERRLTESARSSDFFAFGLHDCYAAHWIDSYPALLEKLGSCGTFVTADQMADRVLWLQGTELTIP